MRYATGGLPSSTYVRHMECYNTLMDKSRELVVHSHHPPGSPVSRDLFPIPVINTTSD
jgi:ribulose-5-phosphate 4-epimerase/fuculose-1-phosphate aldolase